MQLMLKPVIVIFLILLISGCAKNEHTLQTSKRAKLITELIIDDTSCSGLKARLKSPSIDDDAIERVYFDALKLGCVHKDV